MKANEGQRKLIGVNNGRWRWMKVNRGKWKQTKMNESNRGKWRWMMDLSVCQKQIEQEWRQRIIVVAKHKFSSIQRVDLEDI